MIDIYTLAGIKSLSNHIITSEYVRGNVNKKWEQLMQQMPVLLEELRSQPLRPPEKQGILPKMGIYVFYEDGKPIYTGRTRNMRRRLGEHCQPSSGHTSATFAFTIAKREAEKLGINTKVTRKHLVSNPDFVTLYLKAKQRVSKMPVRVIEINDPITQTIFEVYAVMCLNTKEYNDFDTH